MIPLVVKEYFDDRYPDFPIHRLLADVWFEPIRPDLPTAYTYFSGALFDSAAPYVVVPFQIHRSGHFKVYQELGRQPFRILSEHGAPILQRFAEIGLRFLTRQPGGGLGFWPEQFVH